MYGKISEKIKSLIPRSIGALKVVRQYLNDIEYKKSRTYRVIVTSNDGSGCGSGFFVSKNKFLTCFHVVFGTELRNIREDRLFVAAQGSNEHEKLQNYFANRVLRIEIEISGNRYVATLVDFSEKYDAVLLNVDTRGASLNISRLNLNPKLTHGRQLFFAGFPTHHDYAFDKTPVAVHQGILSAFIHTVIGGDKYEHLQINSINLGGNSGAPLFCKSDRRVVGIINGNMNWGRDDLAAFTSNLGAGLGVSNFNRVALRVPLSIAYATTIKTLWNETTLLRDL